MILVFSVLLVTSLNKRRKILTRTTGQLHAIWEIRFFNGRAGAFGVQVASLFEAVCRAWSNFKSAGGTGGESYKTKEFIVEVHQDPKFLQVELEKLLEWLDRGRRVSRDKSS
jgi:hypothetical protein